MKPSPRMPVAALTIALAACSRQAGADDTITRPGDHPNYVVDVELKP